MNYRQHITDILNNYRKKSIVPDSNFSVACVIEDNNHNLYPGANIEFIDRTLGICAEGAAISKMLSERGYQVIQNIWLMGGDAQPAADMPEDLLFPCGVCLQRLGELAAQDAKVNIISPVDNHITDFNLNDLLPHINKFADYFDLKPYNVSGELDFNNIPSALKMLRARSFIPDHKKNESIILQTQANHFCYGVYFATCCYKADIAAINMAMYNYLLSEYSAETISHVYYSAENSLLQIHPEFSKLLKDAVLTEIEIEN